MKKIIILLTIIILFPVPAFSDTQYIKSSKTKVKKESTPRSEVVAVLNKGTKLTVLGKKGKFLKVKMPDGNIGWVFKFKVSKKKPGGGGNLFSSLGGSGISKQEASSGGSIRGLSKVSEDYAKSEGIKKEHIDAVKKMETFKVSDKDLDTFMQEGNLGEYGGE